MTLVVDKNLKAIQGFAPQRIEAVTASVAWTPDDGDVAFCVPSDCTYTIDGTGASGSLEAREIRVVREGQTYTFDTTMNIEVA